MAYNEKEDSKFHQANNGERYRKARLEPLENSGGLEDSSKLQETEKPAVEGARS
jgi:hypothetical protein